MTRFVLTGPRTVVKWELKSRNVMFAYRGVLQIDLATLRKKRGLTQEELAAILGVTTSAVGNWEAGLRRPRYENLRRLAQVLGVTIDDLTFPTASTERGEKRAG